MNVKNKTHAPMQITAEHILCETRAQQEPENQPPQHSITDEEELAAYRLQKRKEFEDLIKRARKNTNVWLKYAQWESSHGDFARARSIWERALEVDYTNSSLWLKYSEMEMRNKFVNHARNVWERALSLLPRVDQLWFAHLEEMLGNVAGARQIFERWMVWEPGYNGWDSYIQFELRWKETERARAIYNRARQCCNVDGQTMDEHFGEFDEIVEFRKEFDELERPLSEEVIVRRKRLEYEEEVKKVPLNYDSWFDYIRLEENVGEKEMVREVYERAIANVPPAEQKRYWHRYIYLWINYVLYEELMCEDYKRTRAIFKSCFGIIPHAKFTFAKVWIMAAQFEIRQKDLKAARTIMGNAIGRAPKDKLFKTYIDMELQLGNVNRCRILYGKYLEWAPENCRAWSRYAELERSLGEIELARSIFEIAVKQPLLDMPELLWKGIDLERSQGEHGRTRDLYERLLDRTKDLKVWSGYAKFEAEVPLKEEAIAQEEGRQPDFAKVAGQAEKRAQRTRGVFERAYESLLMKKDERAVLLEEWEKAERSFGEFGDFAAVERKLAKKLSKRKRLVTAEYAGFEAEYPECLFPAETSMAPNLKLLEAAYKWKRLRTNFDH